METDNPQKITDAKLDEVIAAVDMDEVEFASVDYIHELANICAQSDVFTDITSGDVECWTEDGGRDMRLRWIVCPPDQPDLSLTTDERYVRDLIGGHADRRELVRALIDHARHDVAKTLNLYTQRPGFYAVARGWGLRALPAERGRAHISMTLAMGIEDEGTYTPAEAARFLIPSIIADLFAVADEEGMELGDVLVAALKERTENLA